MRPRMLTDATMAEGQGRDKLLKGTRVTDASLGGANAHGSGAAKRLRVAEALLPIFKPTPVSGHTR